MNISDISIEKKWFIVFFVAGFFGIPLLKYIGIPQFFTTGFACILISIYAWVLLKNKKNYCGDNVYYMGFLFTLISLTSALYDFNSNDAISSIISNFSIALGSTIVGFFLRILFVQYDEETVAKVETQKHQELSEAAEKLTYVMRASIQEFNDYAESFGAIRHNAEQAMFDGMEETNAQFGTLFNEIVDQYSDINAAQKKQLDTFDAAVQKMLTMDTPSDVLAKKLDPAMQEIALLMDTLRKKRQAEDRAAKKTDAILEKFNANLEQCASKLEKTKENMDGFITDMDLLRDAAKEINELKDSIAQQIARQNTLNHQYTTLHSGNIDTISQQNRAYQSALDEANRAVQKMTKSMQDITLALQPTVQKLQETIETISNAEIQSQKMMQENVQETLSAARSVNLVLGQMVEHTTMQLRKDA